MERKLMTKDDINQMEFFQMPRAFFEDPKYKPMRIESKIAYTLMCELLPMAAQKGWVNEKGEIYVNFSRAELMRLLNIKGTQKAAQVIKELTEYGLIFSKKIGLTRYNEIYLYKFDGIDDE